MDFQHGRELENTILMVSISRIETYKFIFECFINFLILLLTHIYFLTECRHNIIILETKKLVQKQIQLGNNKEKQNRTVLFYKENQD